MNLIFIELRHFRIDIYELKCRYRHAHLVQSTLCRWRCRYEQHTVCALYVSATRGFEQ